MFESIFGNKKDAKPELSKTIEQMEVNSEAYDEKLKGEKVKYHLGDKDTGENHIDQELSELDKALKDPVMSKTDESGNEFGAPTQERPRAYPENSLDKKPENKKGPWDDLEGSGQEAAAQRDERDTDKAA